MTMNTDAREPVPERRGGCRWGCWLIGLVALLMAGVVFCGVAAWRTLTPDRDVAVLHDQLTKAGGLAVHPKVRMSVGPVWLALARGVVHFIDQVPPDGRDGLRAARRASVSVDEVSGKVSEEQRLAMISAADAAMGKRGWARSVSVCDDENVVLIFCRKDQAGDEPMRLCLAVCDGKDFVTVSAEVEAEPLARIVERHHDEIAAKIDHGSARLESEVEAGGGAP